MNLFKNLFKGKGRGNPSAVVSISDKTTAIWPTRNYENFAKETYLKNSIAFRCIDMIARSTASVKWKLMEVRKDGYKTELTTHPILDLMYRPNRTQGWTAFCQAMVSYLVMSGNSYIRRVAPETGPNRGIPKEIDLLRPDRVKVLATNDAPIILGYEYQYTGGQGVSSYTKQYYVDPLSGKCEVLHLRSFNPTDDFYGTAITEPLSREIDTQNSATEWNKKLLDNEARPGLIISYNKNLSDEQYLRLEKQFKSRYSGSDNAGRNLILEGAEGVKIDNYGFNMAEMDFIQGNKELCTRISSGYGVPAQLIGIADSATFANYEQARESFWDETVIYYLNLIKTEFNNWFFEKDSNIELNYSLDGIPAYASRQGILWERARSADFISINEKRELVGYERVEGGDAILIPMSSIPLGEDFSAPTESEGGSSQGAKPIEAEEEGSEEDSEEEKAKAKIGKRGYNKYQIDTMMGESW